jgi:hypothetical protein
MQFVHHDLGSRSGGEIVEIKFSGSAGNPVRLMDSANFNSYQNGHSHRCIGAVN